MNPGVLTVGKAKAYGKCRRRWTGTSWPFRLWPESGLRRRCYSESPGQGVARWCHSGAAGYPRRRDKSRVR